LKVKLGAISYSGPAKAADIIAAVESKTKFKVAAK